MRSLGEENGLTVGLRVILRNVSVLYSNVSASEASARRGEPPALLVAR